MVTFAVQVRQIVDSQNKPQMQVQVWQHNPNSDKLAEKPTSAEMCIAQSLAATVQLQAQILTYMPPHDDLG